VVVSDMECLSISPSEAVRIILGVLVLTHPERKILIQPARRIKKHKKKTFLITSLTLGLLHSQAFDLTWFGAAHNFCQ